MVHHDRQVLSGCQLDQFFCFAGSGRERLLDEYVLPVLQRRLCQLEVGPNRRYDGHGINVRRSQYCFCIAGNLHLRMGPANPLMRGRILVAYDGDLTIVHTLKVPRDLWAPVTVTDNSDAYHAFLTAF